MLDDIALNLLRRTRMSEKQSRVYLAALQLGTGAVTDIAEVAGLKRSITYVILEQLIVDGYISLVPGKKKQIYAATDPTSLAAELDQTAHDFREMLGYLRTRQARAGRPFVSYYTGMEGAVKAFQQIRRPKEARYAISIDKALYHVPLEVERWEKTYLSGKARPGGRHLLTDTVADRKYGRAIASADQIVRYLGKDNHLEMDLALVDDVVYLTAFDDHDIHVTVIESQPLYRSLCTLYDLSWVAAKR